MGIRAITYPYTGLHQSPIRHANPARCSEFIQSDSPPNAPNDTHTSSCIKPSHSLPPLKEEPGQPTGSPQRSLLHPTPPSARTSSQDPSRGLHCSHFLGPHHIHKCKVNSSFMIISPTRPCHGHSTPLEPLPGKARTDGAGSPPPAGAGAWRLP